MNTVELGDDVAFGENARAVERVSSDLKSLETLRLDELSREQIQTIAAAGDFVTLHMRNVQVGGMVRGFHLFFKDHTPLVSAMRDIMRPVRGSHKRTKVGDVEMTWGEYCLNFYGVGHDWVNRMLKGEHTQDNPEIDDTDSEFEEATEGLEQTIKPKLSKKDLPILDLKKKNCELLEQLRELLNQKPDDVPEPQRPEVAEMNDPEPAEFDIGDPYFHFHQFRDEPQTMASELAAMLIEFNLDEQQTAIILDLVKKQLKAQHKALGAA